MTAAPRTRPHRPERVKRRHTPSPGPHAPTESSPSHATTPLHRLTDESRLGFVVSRRLGASIGLADIHARRSAAAADAKLNEEDGKRLREMASQLRLTLLAE